MERATAIKQAKAKAESTFGKLQWQEVYIGIGPNGEMICQVGVGKGATFHNKGVELIGLEGAGDSYEGQLLYQELHT